MPGATPSSNPRRMAIKALAGGAALSMLPAWARSGPGGDFTGLKKLSGEVFDLHVAESSHLVGGRRGKAIAVNGQVPAPLLRWREGDEITIRLHNHLAVDTSIHWHGILLPYQMDGVPGVSFPGVKPGETFTYRFPLRQAGTYWYHSHSGVQEQSGHYGPIVIEPRDSDPVDFDREYVIVLSDWTFEAPEKIFAKLKKSSETYNYQQRTLGDFVKDARAQGFRAALGDRVAWGRMRMSPADIADVTGAAYTYLINGHPAEDNWTALFTPGERIRLRFINASAMTIFNVRIPGLPMMVVQADGLNVKPVEIDEFQIGVAETYDVVVTPPSENAHTLMCESMDRSGYVRATLAPRMGMSAPVPALRERPTLTMTDMGMSHHGAHNHENSETCTPEHAAMGHCEPDVLSASSAQKGNPGEMHHPSTDGSTYAHLKGVGVDGVAVAPIDRLGEPGLGLENQPHRVLRYTDMESLEPNPDLRPPSRELELHLTGNMERYMWSFDGRKFSEVRDPIRFRYNERVRMKLVNHTMMAHPIHLHGMFFELVTQDSHHKPCKHTVIVKPGGLLHMDVTANEPGHWAFHCHLLYHMMAGMMRVVSVSDAPTSAGVPPRKSHG